MTRSFLSDINERVLICDGAMGTMLYARGVFINRCFDELNLSQPDLIAEIHQAYARAGADVLETNTFGANRMKLIAHGLADRLHAINVSGARIARHVARDERYVAGAIGPLGVRIEPWGKTGVDEAEAIFREQAAALAEGGVDLFILETFRDASELCAAIRAVRAVSDRPVVAQMTIEEDGHSLDGTPPEVFGPAIDDCGADLVGANCSVGPAPMLETIERMAQMTKKPLSAQPNAGKPRSVEGRNIYLCSPEYMASYARRFILAGVKLVGGCCGTTPEHIRAMKNAVRAMAPATRVTVGAPAVEPSRPDLEPVPKPQKSRLAHAMTRGKFVVMAELLPPKGFETDAVLDQARALKIHGVDVINIPDGPRASARMSPMALAVLVEQQAGIETMLHYTCRDRNLLGMQSDLLGAHAMGLRNVLAVTGDPPRTGTYPDATAVFDVDSIGLTHMISRLNRGVGIGGEPIGRQTAFHVGVAANPGAPNLDEEIRRFEYKVEAGAEFAVTQPIFDLRQLEVFLARTAHVRIPIVAGLVPLTSLRHAEFMANEVPGVTVPDAVLERIRAAEARGTARTEGLAIAHEMADAVRGLVLVQGLQISAPYGRIESALEMIEALV